MKVKYVLIGIFCIAAMRCQAQQDSVKEVLELSDLSLDELLNVEVITATGFLQKTSEAPSTIQVINAQQITDRGYEQLQDVLRDIPGIDMIHLNGYAPTLIYFRGMYGAENLRALLMVDGIAENNIIGSNDMAGPAYSLHNVERIEIISGPASALYGANAFGGVINIITKKGSIINGFYAEKGAGSFNTSSEKISVGFHRSNFEMALSGSLYSTDGPKFTNRDPNYSASYVDKAYSVNGSISYRLAKSLTTLGFRAYETPMGWGTFFNSPTVFLGLPSQGYGNKGILGLIARDVRGEKSGLESPYSRTLFLQNELNPGAKLSLLARLVYRETGTSDDSYAYITLDGKKLIRAITTNSSNRAMGEINGNFSPSDKHKFSAGAQFYQDNVEQGSRRATIDTNTVFLIDGRYVLTNLSSTFLQRKFDIRNTFGSYLQYILTTKILGKTSLTLGGRYDYNDYFGSSTSPRVAIVNKPSEQFTFKLQFGTAFRAPTNTEIYQASANFQLETEKITTYEANAIFTPSKKLVLQVNGFSNKLTDVILLSNLSNLTVNKNPGIYRINGLETRADFSYGSGLTGFVNFTYQKATGKNVTTGRQGNIPGIAKVKGNIGTTVEIEDLFVLSLSGNWVGKRKAQSTNPYGDVKGYFLTNASFNTRKLFNGRVSAGFSIQNLFDVKWLDPGFRTADGFLYSTVLEQPGRTGLLKFSVSF